MNGIYLITYRAEIDLGGVAIVDLPADFEVREKAEITGNAVMVSRMPADMIDADRFYKEARRICHDIVADDKDLHIPDNAGSVKITITSASLIGTQPPLDARTHEFPAPYGS